MEILEFLRLPIILFLAVVAPLWVIAHYTTRWHASKGVSVADETMLSDLWESAQRMEDRIANLERILDTEAPGWRTRE